MHVHQLVNGSVLDRRLCLLVSFAIVATAILSGCVAAEKRPSAGELAQVRNIAVIAVEPPPLDATSIPYKEFPNLSAVPNQAMRTVYAGGVVFFGMLLLLDDAGSGAESTRRPMC